MLSSDLRRKVLTWVTLRPEVVLVLLGVILRLKHLLENRPFWLDETCAAISITSRSVIEVFTRSDLLTDIVHPPMFYAVIQKFFVSLLGNNETALRLFPFLCGLGILLSFAVWTRQFLSRRAYLIALSLCAISEPLVYYSAELKQYSTDLLCAIILLWFSHSTLKFNFKTSHCLLLGVFGALVVWLSNAMIFVLAGTGIVFLLFAPWKYGKRKILWLAIAALSWLASFVFLYHLSLKYLSHHPATLNAWQGAFSSAPLFSWDKLLWAGKKIIESFENPAGLKWWIFALPCFVWGAVVLWRKDKRIVLLCLLPMMLTFLASVFGKYPFHGRVILFLTTGYLLFVAAGVDDLLEQFGRKNKLVFWLILAMAFVQPAFDALHYLVVSRSKTDNRAAMEYLSRHYQPGDFMYFSTSALPSFWYYASRTGLSKRIPSPVVGMLDTGPVRGTKVARFALDPVEVERQQLLLFRNEYQVFNEQGLFRANLSSPRDKPVNYVPVGVPAVYPRTGRTWLVVSAPEDGEASSNAQILDSFDKSSKRLQYFEGLRVGVYLYEMK